MIERGLSLLQEIFFYGSIIGPFVSLEPLASLPQNYEKVIDEHGVDGITRTFLTIIQKIQSL